MYIQMKKTGLDVADLIALTRRKKDNISTFPYQNFVCRCGNCLYSSKGKCALKECCCMEERIRAHTCTFGEMMRYCFSGIGDNVFHFRLRIAIERETEMKSCFLNAGHRKRFFEGVSYARKPDRALIAQIFLLSAYDELWQESFLSLTKQGFQYAEIDFEHLDINAQDLLMTAIDMEYGSAHADLLDLSDDEVVDFDVFRTICTAVVIGAYGMDAIKIAEKQRPKRKNYKKGEVAAHE